MTCPHCGADAPEGPKFCPKCSRLLDSPLLRIKQEIDAARGVPLHKQVERSMAERAAAIAARFGEPPPMPQQPQQPAVYRLQNAGPSVRHIESEATPNQFLGRAERQEQARGKRKKPRQSSSEETPHSTSGHRFDQDVHHHGTPPTNPQAVAKAKEKAKAAAEVPPPPEKFGRPATLTVLGLLDIFAAMALFSVFAQITNANPEPRPPLVDTTRYIWGGLSAFFLLTGLAMWGRMRIGRLMQMLTALAMLPLFPMGTIYGVVLLLFLKGAGTKAIFSGKSPRQLTHTQWAAAHASIKFSPVLAVLFFIFAIFPAMGFAGLLMAFVPQAAVIVERVRAGESLDSIITQAQAPANVEPEPGPAGDPQATAVQDIWAVMRAQAAYASLNGGLYDRIECVVKPVNCIPNNDPRNAAVLLEPRFTRMERNGYVFQLLLSEPPESRPDTVSKTGMTEYAYRAVPVSGEGPGFCGRQTGDICRFEAKGVSGDPFKCPDGCTVLIPSQP